MGSTQDFPKKDENDEEKTMGRDFLERLLMIRHPNRNLPNKNTVDLGKLPLQQIFLEETYLTRTAFYYNLKISFSFVFHSFIEKKCQ